jgi:hypothetical protein
MVERLAVIGNRAGIEQDSSQIGIVILSGGAVQGDKRMASVGPGLIGVRVEQQTRTAAQGIVFEQPVAGVVDEG